MFLLQCTGRSGSTYLGSLLDDHPGTTMRGEFLYPDVTADDWIFYHRLGQWIAEDIVAAGPYERAILIRRYLTELAPTDGTLLGLDLKLEMLDTDPALAGPIYEAATTGVVILKRANLLRQVISYELTMARLARQASPVHSDVAPARETLHIDPNLAVSKMAFLSDLLVRYDGLARDYARRCHIVIYEDLVARPEVTLAALLAFLDLPPVDLRSSLVKQNDFPLHELVANYEELAKRVRQSRFEYTLFLD